MHILKTCPLYNDARIKINPSTKIKILNDDLASIFNLSKSKQMRDIAKYLVRCHNLRFPKKSKSEASGEDKIPRRTTRKRHDD